MLAVRPGYRFYCWVFLAAFAFAQTAPADGYAKSTKSTKTSSKSSHGSKKSAAGGPRVSGASRTQYSALVVDASTGRVLYEKNAGSVRYPASLTKMMTLYLTFDALKKGKLSLDDKLEVSSKAASQPQTNISLDAGDRIPLRSAIESVVVRSANDSAMVLAEAIGETQWNFGLLMTQKARELGMKNTVFRNPSGLPDNQQYTTAYDMAKLSIALRRDFPEYYHYFRTQSFTYQGITYDGHNHVMEQYPGVDGIKTGYIRASGFNLATSVRKEGYDLVAVVMGGTSAKIRDAQMIDLLDRTFTELDGRRGNMANSAESEDIQSRQQAKADIRG